MLISRRPQVRGRNIKKALWHDAGAYGQCSNCGRYSDNTQILMHKIKCDCGVNCWSGSFKSPISTSRWSEGQHIEK